MTEPRLGADRERTMKSADRRRRTAGGAPAWEVGIVSDWWSTRMRLANRSLPSAEQNAARRRGKAASADRGWPPTQYRSEKQ